MLYSTSVVEMPVKICGCTAAYITLTTRARVTKFHQKVYSKLGIKAAQAANSRVSFQWGAYQQQGFQQGPQAEDISSRGHSRLIWIWASLNSPDGLWSHELTITYEAIRCHY